MPVSLAFSIAFAADGNGQDSLNVLDPDRFQPQTEEMMRRYIKRISNEALDHRLEIYEELKTREQIVVSQEEMKRFFLSKLDLPERSPLNARIVAKKEFEGYTREKIIYESQPGFFVPAILYLPKSTPPYPGVLVLSGHDENGKFGYQEIGISLARNGMAALLPDPIGQGERKQILNEQGRGIYNATTEHNIEGIAPVLLGRNIASYMIWDGIRGLDYLISRPEIDAERIGCTGNSGGGNRTSYLMALDDRIKCAAPGCFITTTRRKNDAKGPGDAEQNIHGQLTFGMDLPDYIIMRSPKPTLILSATQDFVPIEGAWEAFRQAKRIYTRLGFPECVDLVEADKKHGFTKPLRIAMVRWMRRWLLNIDDAITDDEVTRESDQDIQCTPRGQVLLMPGARSVFDLNIEKEQDLGNQRLKYWQQADDEQLRNKIRDITGIRKIDDLPGAEVEEKGNINRHKYQITKIIINWESDILLPSLLFIPRKVSGDYILYLHDKGKQIDSGPAGKIEKLVLEGNVVFAVDLRGIGETQTTPWRYMQALDFTGSNTAEYFIAYMLGKSFVGMRAEDILISSRYLLELIPTNKEKQIKMIAEGELGPPALHAIALEPELFKSLALRNSLVSWSIVIHTPVTRGAFINTAHGALKFYDLPDLVRMVGAERIVIQEAVDAKNKIVKSSYRY